MDLNICYETQRTQHTHTWALCTDFKALGVPLPVSPTPRATSCAHINPAVTRTPARVPRGMALQAEHKAPPRHSLVGVPPRPLPLPHSPCARIHGRTATNVDTVRAAPMNFARMD